MKKEIRKKAYAYANKIIQKFKKCDSISEGKIKEYILQAFFKGFKTININIKNLPTIDIECSICAGEGYIQHSVNPDDANYCPKCKGTGKRKAILEDDIKGEM